MVELDLMDYPLEKTLSYIQGKWKLYIICSLLKRPKSFGELQRSLGSISQKVLTESLRSMEKDGLLTRVRYTEGSELYKLTKIGYGFSSVIEELVRWGRKYESSFPYPDNINS